MVNSPKAPLAPIPASTEPANLIPTINARLRSISLGIGQNAGGTVPLLTALPVKGSTYAVDGTLVDYTQALFRWNATLGTPQFMGAIPLVTALPTPGSQYAQDGRLVDFQQSLYRWNAATGTAQQVSGGFYQDTHANRVLNFPAANFPIGSIFYETDNRVFLLNQLVGPVAPIQGWVPVWAHPIEDLQGNLGNYYAPYFPDGQTYLASDVPPSYYAQAGGGNVTVSGGVNVLRTTGVNFDVRWVGYPILISGQAAIVGAVLDANHITLASPVLTVGTGEWLMPALAWQASAAVLAGSHGLRLGLVVTALPVGTVFLETDRNAVYTILANGLLNANTWNYISGEYADVFANRPTDLGPFDLGFIFTAIDVHFSERWANGWTYYAGVAQGSLFQMNALPLTAAETGLLFAETTYGHLYVWSGTSWAFAPGDSGAGYIVFGPEPLGGIWYPCNGASYSISAGNGGLTTVVTPNITGTLAALYGGGYNVNPIPSISPTVTVNVAATKTVSGLTPGTDLAAGQSIIPTINPGNPEYFSLSAWIRG